MTTFLGEVGRKLADRWIELLAVPGLLYLAAIAVAVALRQQHALDLPELTRRINGWAGSTVLRSPGAAVLIVGVVLAGSVVTGLVASALGGLVEKSWLARGGWPPARWLAQWRQRRSRAAKRIADDPASTAEQVRRAIARADRICLVESSRPTWIGDRLRAAEVRVERAYGLDLGAIWPRLWLVVPDIVRVEVGAAHDSFAAAARLVGWAVLYVVLAIWWWPAAIITLATLTAGVVKARTAAGVLADLVESAVDLHADVLAAEAGVPVIGTLTADQGTVVTTLIRKSRWDPGSPTAD